ncbi:P-loop containing nucleoside triphosphate hydrolase protein [Irpex rosettiformis]|uniref:P-loop containing nucleoside triphosphate hydrolase protein n=1 Tax=Irpex rosettiformis TaxID=378272 RepID=A0ACB8U135_9APHY|nr:P-loop containing nucleoside triphosphate hydrolase protein [Irpex rosettiformis]
MQTRNSVLGKRQSSREVVTSPSTPSKSSSASRNGNVLPTPENTPNPKRMKLSETVFDGHNNKENIPPLRIEAINSLAPPTRSRRASRRNSTDQLFSSRRESSLRRYASLSQLPVTPSRALSRPALATPPPTPPSSLQPISSRVRALLRPTCNGSASMSGRETERKLIADFVSSFLRAPPSAPDHSILYISGSPGTGKTALVNALLGEMRDDFSDAAVTVVTVNCMALDSTEALLERLIEEFSDTSKRGTKGGKARKTKETTLQTLDSLLTGATRRSILLLDELDHVASSTSSLTTLFTLVHTHHRILRAIGIANTHTLSTTSAATSMSAMTLTGVHTLHFAPYTPHQLLEIVQARLSTLRDIESNEECDEELTKFLPSPTLTLLTKKVASLTGDVRALLEVLRGAINIAINAVVPKKDSSNPLDVPAPSVLPIHVLEALKAYSPSSSTSRPVGRPAASITRKTNHSEVVAKIEELGLQPRLALMSIVLARKRLDSQLPLSGSLALASASSSRALKRTSSSNILSSTSTGIDIGVLYTYYKTVLSRSEGGVFTPVSRSEFGDLLGMLETVGLVQMSMSSSSPASPSKSKRSLSRTASFGAGASKGSQEIQLVAGVRIEEVCKGLGINDSPSNDTSDVMAEEVRAIWEKERVRISREFKARSSNSISTGLDAFEEALAD